MRVSIRLAPAALKEARRAIRTALPEIKSSTITECLAYGLGFRSNAVLQASLRDFPDFGLFIGEDFVKRLQELDPQPGVRLVAGLESNLARRIREQGPDLGFVLPDDLPPNTVAEERPEYDLDEAIRRRVWRKVMIGIVNEAQRRKLFSLVEGDIRWSADLEDGGHFMPFSLDGVPVACTLRDTGDKHIRIDVALWPTAAVEQCMMDEDYDLAASRLAGDIYAATYLSLEHGSPYLVAGSDPEIYGARQPLQEADRMLKERRPGGFAHRTGWWWADEVRSKITGANSGRDALLENQPHDPSPTPV